MGKMKQLWSIPSIRKDIKEVVFSKEMESKLISELYYICIAAAQTAKNDHSYENYKGELESSTGFIILKNRKENLRWKWIASEGTDPNRGFKDFSQYINTEIRGKSTLPDGSYIPEKSIIAVVVAAAPYAGVVEDNGRTVLNDFMPNFSIVHQRIKKVFS